MHTQAEAITALETSRTELTQQLEAAMATLTQQTALLTARTIKNSNNKNQNWNGREEKRSRFPPYGDHLRSSNFGNRRRWEPEPTAAFITPASNPRRKTHTTEETANKATAGTEERIQAVFQPPAPT